MPNQASSNTFLVARVSISVKSDNTTVVSAETRKIFPDVSERTSLKLTAAPRPRSNIGAHGDVDNKIAVPTHFHATTLLRKPPDDFSQPPTCLRAELPACLAGGFGGAVTPPGRRPPLASPTRMVTVAPATAGTASAADDASVGPATAAAAGSPELGADAAAEETREDRPAGLAGDLLRSRTGV